MNSMNIKEVMNFLPHRYPFLLIDKVVMLQPKESISAIKNVTINEPFFQGHFPGNPVMPGVLIIEAMAQASGILALNSDEALRSGKLFYFLAIESAKFRVPVLPGDVLKINANIIKFHGTVCKFDCTVFVEDRKVSEAIITAKVIIDV